MRAATTLQLMQSRSFPREPDGSRDREPSAHVGHLIPWGAPGMLRSFSRLVRGIARYRTPVVFIYALVNRHIDESVNKEWPEMAQQRMTLAALPTALIELLQDTLTLKPADESQRLAQSEVIKALQTAADARRQRIVVSQSTVGRVKWAGILLMGLCTLVAIAMVHADNRRACAITLTLFATGVALSVLLIAAYSRPFTGEISVGPELLKQVIATEAKVE